MSTYHNGLGAVFFVKKDAEAQDRGYATLGGFGTLAEAPEITFQSLEYLDTLWGSSFGKFLRVMVSTFEGEKRSKDETS